MHSLGLPNDSFDFIFWEKAREIYKIQSIFNPVFSHFLNLINCYNLPFHISDFKFLPIQFFKQFRVCTHDFAPETVFKSSSTTGTGQSFHHVPSITAFQKNCIEIFEELCGKLEHTPILAVLPGYTENPDSSLICMIRGFISHSKHNLSGFYHPKSDILIQSINDLNAQKMHHILFGVTWSLLDLIQNKSINFNHSRIMFTGGMKGRNIFRPDSVLSDLFLNVNPFSVESEFGMTELSSQAYSNNGIIYQCPESLRVVVTDLEDPFNQIGNNKWGRLNFVDLNNLHSCAFIASDDIGMSIEKNKFLYGGRVDFSDIRGCSQIFQG